jgi:hypothetical protein
LGEQLATPLRGKPRRYGMFHVFWDFKEKWRADVNTKINFGVPQNGEKFLSLPKEVLTSQKNYVAWSYLVS